MASVNQTTFLPTLVARVEDRIEQLEQTGEGGSRIQVDLLLILAMAKELDAYLNGDLEPEESLEPVEQALVIMTQVMEEARQEYLELFSEKAEGGTTWH